MKKIVIAMFVLFSFSYGVNNYTTAFMSYKKAGKLAKRDKEKSYNYYKASIPVFKEAHLEGSVPAGFYLGKIYCNGWGTPVDYNKAAHYFYENIKKGGMVSHCCLAKMYLILNKEANKEIEGERHLAIGKKANIKGCFEVEEKVKELNENLSKEKE